MVEKQSKFLIKICEFVPRVEKMGYLMTLGEGYRPSDVAKIYEAQNKGISNSLHTIRLAQDLNAFSGKNWLDGSQNWHIPILNQIGSLWESLDPLCRWGGRFSKKDYNHYSFEHNGVK